MRRRAARARLDPQAQGVDGQEAVGGEAKAGTGPPRLRQEPKGRWRKLGHCLQFVSVPGGFSKGRPAPHASSGLPAAGAQWETPDPAGPASTPQPERAGMASLLPQVQEGLKDT